MNHGVPDWNSENDTRSSFRDLIPMENQKKSMAPDNELIELLWRNGHVVMHSQTHRRPPATVTEFKQAQKQEPLFKCGDPLGNSSDLIHEDGPASWFQYPLDDSLEKEFCSDFFCEMPAADAITADKLDKDLATEGSGLCYQESTMPPPKSHATGSNQHAPSLKNSGAMNFPHFSRPMNVGLGFLNGQKGSGNGIQVGTGESSSMMTIGSSACGSNQVQNRVNESRTFSTDETGAFTRSTKEDVQMKSPCEGVQMNTHEGNVTSTSGGSGSSFGRMGLESASNRSHKRKGRGGEGSECHSEEANKPAQRSASARRTRATEVHNLSERRRRDRINEKMKALQELIPHCNKSDKASMLDEAIEYLKSLQLQVQVMWMGGGMAPMMFPGVQQYMPCMGVGTAHAPMPSFHNPVQLSRVPLVNQSIPSAPTANQTPMCPSPALNPVDLPTQMQNIHLAESYARYFAFHRMQPPPQAMNLYTHGSHTEQQNQPAAAAAASNSGLPAVGAVPYGKAQNG